MNVHLHSFIMESACVESRAKCGEKREIVPHLQCATVDNSIVLRACNPGALLDLVVVN